MKNTFDEEVCPVCHTVNYVTEDYGEDFSGLDGSAQWWICRCKNCGCLFDIEYSYKLANISVTRLDQNN